VTAINFTLTLALLVFRQIRYQVLTNICASADRLRKECRRPGWKEVRYIIFYGFLVMLLWHVFDRVMFESRGEVFTAFVNNLGDLPPAILAPGLAVFATEFALGLALLLRHLASPGRLGEVAAC
jgi:hypothetical protein